MKNCKQTAENCIQTAENQKNCTPLKRILALPTWGQKCIVLELQLKDISNFDLGHPVSNEWALLNVEYLLKCILF